MTFFLLSLGLEAMEVDSFFFFPSCWEKNITYITWKCSKEMFDMKLYFNIDLIWTNTYEFIHISYINQSYKHK